MNQTEIFEEIKDSCFSFGEARRLALHISEMPEDKQKEKIKRIKDKPYRKE